MTGELLIAGCMCGTSLDGLDAALVRIHQDNRLRAEIVATRSAGFGEVFDGLAEFTRGEPMDAERIGELRWSLGELHADLVSELCVGHTPDLVVVHGQTVFHRPPRTWQMIEPAPIARRVGCPVLSNLRAADVAAGGQGAPITPIADAVLFRDAPMPCALVNLGGFCNISLLEQNESGVQARGGADICACNQLLDNAARTLLSKPMDENGQNAARGTPVPAIVEHIGRELSQQRSSGRSLGTGDELLSRVSGFEAEPEDTLASIVEAVARTIIGAVGQAEAAIIGGGGTHNAALVDRIAHHTACEVHKSDTFGVPAQFREAACMAVLGALTLGRQPITDPRITGCDAPAPTAGDWTLPPDGGWRVTRDD